ncbi:MAG: methylmalonyl Co-A mutase-associated GTPase MeaB [Sterolibacterium sp.]|nr:methylmalonyl Co-A mutase-associated GTPase MeaB [Sterolibacterium sp.]
MNQPQTHASLHAPGTTVDIGALANALNAGDIRTCARLITRIERGEEEMVPLLQALYRRGGSARVIGITGPPGAGKSTLINQLVTHWRRKGLRVAVLAVDPSSPISGGAILGDRLRMAAHSGDRGVYIRSMASRGQLGGLSKAAGDALTVLDAMNWDVVLIETVGVGQNETDIMRHASVVLLLQTPMGGDDVQAAKAGIIEIGDIFVVNKSDHPDADRTVQQLQHVLSLSRCLHPDKAWAPPVVKTKALDGEGIADLADHIDRRFAYLADQPETAHNELRARAKHRVGEILRDLLDKRMRSDDGQWLETLIEPMIRRESDPYTLAANLLARMLA